MHTTFWVTTNTITGQQQQLKATTLIWQQLKNEQQARQQAERTSDVEQNEASAALLCCCVVNDNDAAVLLTACNSKTNITECKCPSNEWAKAGGKHAANKVKQNTTLLKNESRGYDKTHVRRAAVVLVVEVQPLANSRPSNHPLFAAAAIYALSFKNSQQLW